MSSRTAVLPKPPTWRLIINEQTIVNFTGRVPKPRRRHALQRWFNWKIQISRINGEWIDA